jgi:hypothetical protein
LSDIRGKQKKKGNFRRLKGNVLPSTFLAACFLLGLLLGPQDQDSTFLSNVDSFLQDCAALQTFHRLKFDYNIF